MEELREERRQQGGGREDKGWMNNAFCRGEKATRSRRRKSAKGKKSFGEGLPLTLRSAPEISGYLSLSLSLNLSAHASLFSFRSFNGEGDGDGVGELGAQD